MPAVQAVLITHSPVLGQQQEGRAEQELLGTDLCHGACKAPQDCSMHSLWYSALLPSPWQGATRFMYKKIGRLEKMRLVPTEHKTEIVEKA